MSEVISLSKGEVINLSKIPAIDLSKGGRGLKKVTVGLGWDPADKVSSAPAKSGGLFSRLFGHSSSSTSLFGGEDIDCDAFAFRLREGRYEGNDDLVYFGHLETRDDSIKHTGDNLTGDGDGDDEQIIIDLSLVNCDDICIGVNIYRGVERHQDFGMLKNAFIRIVDMETDTELCRYTLDEKYAGYTSIIFGELIKENNDWTFKAKGEAIRENSIQDIVNSYR